MRPHQKSTSPRKDRVRCLFDFIEKHGKDYERDKLLAMYSIRTGISERTLRQYLDTHIIAGLIVVYGNKVMTAPQHAEISNADLQRARELSSDRGDSS